MKRAWSAALGMVLLAGAQAPAHAQNPPSTLRFEHLSLEPADSLQRDCPSQVAEQCWGAGGEAFEASGELRARVAGHVQKLALRGVAVRAVRVVSTCTQRLNRARAQGGNRFLSVLHAMESLLIALRQHAGRDLTAVCGKVGGMTDYDRFFGPLSGRLHTTLVMGKKKSGYYFPGLGEVYFVQDADARDPLVMLASLVGKYVRELLMARISRFHGVSSSGEGAPTRADSLGAGTPTRAESDQRVSGYHDPKTSAWVEATRRRRRALRVLDDCFERARDAAS